MQRKVKIKHNSYYEHDDRGGESSERRVSFKTHHRGGRNKHNRQRGWDNKVRALLLDEDDVDMLPNAHQFSGKINKHFVRGFGRRGGQRIIRGPSRVPVKKLQPSPVDWYKVSIVKGSKYDRQYLFQILLNYIKPVPLVPYGFEVHNEDAVFFIDNYETGTQLLTADRKITANDGWKLTIFVRPNFPNITVDDSLKEKLKFVMGKRYNPNTKALDLSRFHTDSDLMKADLLVTLNRSHILSEVIRIIAESVPDLVGLDLSDNKLTVIEPLKLLPDKIPNLKVLHIGKNMFRNVHCFECLKPLAIEELVLDGNPLCDKYNQQDVYVRDVRRFFPKILNLDGVILPREISFDLEETHKLKPSQGSFLCDSAGGAIVVQFLEQYYSLYDSGSRAALIDAYKDDAVFSMTAKSTSSLSRYAIENRNLIQNPKGKNNLLKKGRENIISVLESLPQTQHDPASFAIDLSFFTPKLIVLSICGVFREVGSKLPMRAFSRSFVIVPAGTGFCIVNDLLHITLATAEQVKEAFKTAPAPTSVTAPAAPMPAAPAVAPDTDLAQRQQLISTFAMQSGMNVSWAEKCLNETSWDYNRAMFVFTELQKQGTIPAEAFIK